MIVVVVSAVGVDVNIPLVEVHVRLLADQVAVAAAHALDFGQGVHDFLLAIDLLPFVSVYAWYCPPRQFHRSITPRG
jgi:hypothetical protein